ncbi:MAG: pyroglutamyl-peptidase I family protein [Hyphomicrobium sp.]
MPPHRPAILITGFGPFPGVPSNVSATLAQRLGTLAAHHFPNKRIVTEVLATEWSAAPRHLARLYETERPVLTLHFGVSREARGFVIERVARNACRSSADAAGCSPDSQVLAEGEAGELRATLPADRIVQRLRRIGVPAITSDDAGGYLCNAVLFHSLRLAAAMPEPASSGFVHVPVGIPDTGPDDVLDWPKAVAGGLEILRTGLGLPPPAVQG